MEVMQREFMEQNTNKWPHSCVDYLMLETLRSHTHTHLYICVPGLRALTINGLYDPSCKYSTQYSKCDVFNYCCYVVYNTILEIMKIFF